MLFATIIIVYMKMNCCKGEKIIIETKNGLIKGSKMKSKQGKRIYAFRGIPYANPPLRERRFRRSEPAAAWSGLRDGTREASKSYQPNVMAPGSPFREGGEDCLYLNVYTRRFEKEASGIICN